jgi:ribonuclease HI
MGEQLKYVLQILWEVSNNEAEYEALLHGLRLAISQGIKRLLAYGNSLLVVQQVNKDWDCNKETMDAYVHEVRKLENKFSSLEIHHVLREHNVGADILSKLGSTRAQVPPGVFIQELNQPSINVFTHVLVAIDKFTKWTEYKPISMLTPDRVVDFINDILHRFGFTNTIIMDLGSNFTANQFWEFCENACIEVKYVSVAHPRANGHVERANGMIIDGLKKRLYDENSKKGGKWICELPHVVWGLRTQSSKATGQTPFFLVYGSESILPADIMWKSLRVEMYNEGEADEARQLELDSVEEARCTALVQSVRYLQGIRRYHDRNVRERSFSIGDLVLRRIQDESSLHKLNLRWEGPFVVKQVTRPGSYRLHYPEGPHVPNSWNIQNLRKFYT